MMQFSNIIALSLIFILLACQKTQIEDERIQLKRSPHFLEMEYEPERLELADFLEDYLNIMFDSSQTYRNAYWESKILYTRFDRFLKVGRAKEYLIEHPPQLMGIRKDENGNYRMKLTFMRDEFPEEIVELIAAKAANGKFYFIEGIGERSKAFEYRAREGIAFYYSPKCQPDSMKEEKVINYNQSLASYFGASERSLRIIVCKDLKDYADLLGVDYATYLNLDRQSGGRALPDEDLYISANGSAFYPHELVHIYTSSLDPHPFMDEGMATYLGGSGGVSLEAHLKVVASIKEEFDFSKLPKDFYLYENFQASYIIGGMILRLANEQYGGKKAVMELLSTGREDEKLLKTIESIFGIDRTEFDSFIKNELRKIDGSSE